jgi:hypothetical protein
MPVEQSFKGFHIQFPEPLGVALILTAFGFAPAAASAASCERQDTQPSGKPWHSSTQPAAALGGHTHLYAVDRQGLQCEIDHMPPSFQAVCASIAASLATTGTDLAPTACTSAILSLSSGRMPRR